MMGSPQNTKSLENQGSVEILLNPEMGNKVKFANENGPEIDKVISVRAENGSVHIDLFVRIQL